MFNFYVVLAGPDTAGLPHKGKNSKPLWWWGIGSMRLYIFGAAGNGYTWRASCIALQILDWRMSNENIHKTRTNRFCFSRRISQDSSCSPPG